MDTNGVSQIGLKANAEGLRAFFAGLGVRPFLTGITQLTLGLAAIFVLGRFNFLLAHVFAELFSVAVAWTVFFIVWNGRKYFENGFFLFIGIGLLFIGIVDTVHTIAYEGMSVFRGTGTDLPTQLWILARYMEGLVFLSAPLFLRRKIPPKTTFGAAVLVTAAALAAVFSGYFPSCHVQGVGLTPFKIISEYIISLMLLLSLWLLYRKRGYFSLEVLLYAMAAVGATVASELLFTFYIGVYDISNLLGHYLKIVSFYLLYRGVIVKGIREPYSILAHQLSKRSRELEKSREDLLQTQKITSTMLDNLPEEISLLDEGSYRVIDANRAFIDRYGGNRDEILGRTCYEITHGLDEPCSSSIHPCPLEYAKDIQYGKPVIHRHYNEKGKERFVEITVWRVQKDTHKEGRQVVHIARDVTERTRTEQMREDVERVVRHDLKSPLNGIIGGARLLRQSAHISEKEREIIEAIQDSGKSVLRIVDSSLDMYKMAEGTYELNPALFDLKEPLSRLISRFNRGIEAKKLSIKILIDGSEFVSAEPFYMMGEEQTIETLLANLLQNAVEATPKGGKVTLRVSTENSNVLFDIQNEGIIPEQVRDRFFERYVTAGKRGGTGLGTYSASLIARAHGGTIWFTTDEEEGTHLLVRIPPGKEKGS